MSTSIAPSSGIRSRRRRETSASSRDSGSTVRQDGPPHRHASAARTEPRSTRAAPPTSNAKPSVVASISKRSSGWARGSARRSRFFADQAGCPHEDRQLDRDPGSHEDPAQRERPTVSADDSANQNDRAAEDEDVVHQERAEGFAEQGPGFAGRSGRHRGCIDAAAPHARPAAPRDRGVERGSPR